MKWGLPRARSRRHRASSEHGYSSTRWLRRLLLWPSSGLRSIRPRRGPSIGPDPPHHNGRWTSYPTTTKPQNRTAPSTSKRTPGSPTRGKSISRCNVEVGAGDRLALPLRDPQIETVIVMGGSYKGRSWRSLDNLRLTSTYRPSQPRSSFMIVILYFSRYPPVPGCSLRVFVVTQWVR